MQLDKKIGVTGPIADINFGDYAMLINNIYDINLKNISIFTYNENFSDLLKKEYLLNYNIEVFSIFLKQQENKKYDFIKKFLKKIKRIILEQPKKDKIETPFEILNKVINYDEVAEEISKLDILVVNGGGYFNQLWNSWSRRDDFIKIIVPILIANQQNKKIVFTANGMGPFDEGKEFFRYLFNYLKNVEFAIRDNVVSRSYLNEIGIKDEKIHFIPDDMFIINKKILKCPIKKEIKSKKYIVIEIYNSIEELKKNKNKIIEFASIMLKKYGVNIVFVPFDFNMGGYIQGKYLESQIESLELYDINSVGYLPIQDLYKIIKNAELVLCTRYHALVVSLGAETPVINLVKDVCGDKRYYFNKNYGILNEAFKRIRFNEQDFIKTNFIETLEEIENNFIKIVTTQKLLYNKIYQENKINLSEKRKNYLKKEINDYLL